MFPHEVQLLKLFFDCRRFQHSVCSQCCRVFGRLEIVELATEVTVPGALLAFQWLCAHPVYKSVCWCEGGENRSDLRGPDSWWCSRLWGIIYWKILFCVSPQCFIPSMQCHKPETFCWVKILCNIWSCENNPHYWIIELLSFLTYVGEQTFDPLQCSAHTAQRELFIHICFSSRYSTQISKMSYFSEENVSRASDWIPPLAETPRRCSVFNMDLLKCWTTLTHKIPPFTSCLVFFSHSISKGLMFKWA